MTVFGIHASHEQIHPRALLDAVAQAERAGFPAAMSSDHCSPWSDRQGHSGFAWSWLGAALQATKLPFGVVTAPGQRYHPAIIAQAIATLGAMYPGRFWAAPGSGEASNEHITGQRRPRKEDRNARLRECLDVIRALPAGEEVSHDGLITVDRARLWTVPDPVPALLGAAVTVQTARWCAGWAETDDEAARIAYDQWRVNVFGPPVRRDLETPAHFDQAAAYVTPRQVAGAVRVSADPADPARHAEWPAEYADLGFDAIHLHHVGQHQPAFIDTFGDKVLPRLAP